MTPGSTTARSLARTISRIRRMRAVTISTPSELGSGGVGDACLDHGAFVGQVDFEDSPHAGGDDQDAVGAGERSSGEPGAGAAGDEGQFVFGADAHDLLDLFGGFGQYHDGGGDPV